MTIFPVRALAGLLFATACAICTPASALAGVLSDDVAAYITWAPEWRELPVVVTYKNGPAQRRAHAAKGGGDIIGAVKDQTLTELNDAADDAAQAGASSIRTLWVANSLAMDASPATLATLSQDPDVASVVVDKPFTPFPDVADADSPPPEDWHLAAITIRSLWEQGYAGNGTVVATVDTGADIAVPSLADTWRGGSNSWFDPYTNSTTPYDSSVNAHGTRVLSVLVTQPVTGTNGATLNGVAYGAQWISAKLFDDSGQSYFSTILEIYGWLLDPDDDPATDDYPDVVNNSWGYSQFPGDCHVSLADIVAIFESVGIVMVFSAGNNGPGADTSVSPANSAGAFAAGGSTSAGVVSPASSRGPAACDGRTFPDLVAPGQSVTVFDAQGQTTDSGTSFAAPHVAGAASVLMGLFPNSLRTADDIYDVDLIETALRVGADDMAAAGPDNDTGWGELNVIASYDYLLTALDLCRADLNGDQFVNGADLDLFMAAYEADAIYDCYETYCRGDLNLDGVVNLDDLRVLRNEIGRVCQLK